jgi:predicted metal-dependent phosphoesterase TrpH
MPYRQPFTALCQAVGRNRHVGRADLHLHTRHSDGAYTPTQVVDLARRSGLSAIAITDHDTLEGIAPARTAAAGVVPEVVSGVEISCEYRGREFHLLGHFVAEDDPALTSALERLRRQRADRFWHMVERLRGCGVSLDEGELRAHAGPAALGRRHLADFLVKTGRAGSVREVFARYLGDRGRATVPKVRLPIAEAIALVRGAGGVAGWAHPPYDGTRENLRELVGLGLNAVEVYFPNCRPSRTRELRAWAGEFHLAVTGGSDCHGPDRPARSVGACSVSADELDQLRRAALC